MTEGEIGEFKNDCYTLTACSLFSTLLNSILPLLGTAGCCLVPHSVLLQTSSNPSQPPTHTHAHTHPKIHGLPRFFLPQFPPPVVPRFLYLVPCKSFPCAAPPLSSSLPEVVNWTTEREECVCERERSAGSICESTSRLRLCRHAKTSRERFFPSSLLLSSGR